ncbi:unnamed protein product [Closterium sp. NIES-53]
MSSASGSPSGASRAAPLETAPAPPVAPAAPPALPAPPGAPAAPPAAPTAPAPAPPPAAPAPPVAPTAPAAPAAPALAPPPAVLAAPAAPAPTPPPAAPAPPGAPVAPAAPPAARQRREYHSRSRCGERGSCRNGTPREPPDAARAGSAPPDTVPSVTTPPGSTRPVSAPPDSAPPVSAPRAAPESTATSTGSARSTWDTPEGAGPWGGRGSTTGGPWARKSGGGEGRGSAVGKETVVRHRLVERDILRGQNTPRGGVVELPPGCVRREAKEDTGNGTGGQLVRCSIADKSSRSPDPES